MSGNWVQFIVFIVLFFGVAIMGFMASHWRSGDSMDHLDEWGLGGRKFGGWITWFLVGGDLYTAYTFVAVPALVFGAGALGFYALAVYRGLLSRSSSCRSCDSGPFRGRRAT